MLARRLATASLSPELLRRLSDYVNGGNYDYMIEGRGIGRAKLRGPDTSVTCRSWHVEFAYKKAQTSRIIIRRSPVQVWSIYQQNK
jgi:hypothetical protein